MGNLFKAGSKTTTSTSESSPWDPQQGYLTSGFAQAGNNLNTGVNTINGIGDFTADMTPAQLAALKGSTSLGNGVQGFIQSLMSGGASGANSGLGAFGSNASDIYSKASGDPTDFILQNGMKYADNPALQGQIDAALGDVRKAFDVTKGDINSAAVGSGNINSTRAGVLESRAADDAMDRGAAISSQMRSDAYNNGIQTAQNQYNTGIAQQLQANDQTGQYSSQALQQLLSSYGLGQQGFSDANAAQAQIQQQNQNEIDGKINGANAPMDLIAKYMAAIGGNYGGTTTQTQKTPTASPFQQILGGATSLLGAWGSL